MNAAEHGARALLPGAVVDREWMNVPSNDPASEPPREWSEGLWGLDHAVRAAIRGGWTDDEVKSEVATLLAHYRAWHASPGRGAE